MDSAKNILHSIVLATQKVQNATSRYSITRSVRQVRQHSLVRLESDFQTIVDACRAILEILDNPLRRRHFMLNDRWVDWLSGAEPEMCLDALKEMENLLSIQPEIKGFAGFTPISACKEDDIHAAIVLFHAHKAQFHFLLTTDLWDHESRQRQTIPSRPECPMEAHLQARQVVQALGDDSQRMEITSQKLKKFIKLLDALDCSRRHREASSIRQSDTCLWLLATDVYKSWREDKSSFLWLQGKAGSGKSVLASTVINDLSNTIGDGEFLVYFYCDFRTKRSTSAVEVMRSILAHLISRLPVVKLGSQDLLDELLRENDSHVDRFYSIKGLSCYLGKVARICPQTPIIVVDALDECREVESLLDGLVASTSDLRIFATSRPLQNIVSILSPFPCISMDKMSAELSADILLHVTRELDSRRRLRTFDARLKEEIRSKLCTKADGMFRWVQCQIDTLEKCSSVSEIRKVLESLPEGLEETYRRILIAIDRQLSDARLVQRALVWLVGALRPMTVQELLEGIMIDPDYQALDSRFRLMKGADLLDVCRSLVVHHEESDIITLSHMSVKEYLVGELVLAKLPRYHIVLEDAHEQLARLCIAYIAFSLDQMKESKIQSSILTRDRELASTSYASRPLLKYVLSDGFNHFGHLGPDNTSIFKDMQVLQTIIRRHTWEWDRLRKLVPSIRTGVPWPTSEHDFMFYVLVAFASDVLLEVFVHRAGLMPQEGTNPLVYAAHFGKVGHARALISQGVNPNQLGLIVDDLDRHGPDVETLATPLDVAVDRWNADMINLLLAEGSIVPDALLTRVLEEHPHDFPLSIIKRLLQTPEFLLWAVTPWENGRLLEALLDGAEDYEQVGGGDDITFSVKRLVQVGCAETLLLVAVEKGCIPVIKALLSSSAPHADTVVYALASNGDTPLHVALRLSDEDQCLTITKFLVTAGCSPRERDADDKPPVHIAVVRGFISVVEYLLSQDAPLPSRILFAALQVTPLKRVEMIQFLLSRGATVHVLSPGGDSLLHVAMRSPDRSLCLEIAKIFIDAGCNPLARNPCGETPLCIAAKLDSNEIGNYLLLFSTPSDILSLLQPNPSSQAAVLHLLIGNADGLRFLPEEEDSLLQVIRQFLDNEDKHLAVAKRLVDATRNDPALDSRRLFDDVVRRGFCRVVEYLLSKGISLPQEILFTAVQHQGSMVPFLIRKGATLHAHDKNGDTLLHFAIKTLQGTQCQMTVQALVDAGCQHSTSNDAGKLPIELAVSYGASSVVEFLLSKHTALPQGILSTAVRHQASMVPLLVCRGVNLHATEPNGDTILHVAIGELEEAECLTTTRILFDAGCSPSEPNDSGHAPLDVAVSRGFVSVVEYLLSRHVPLPHGILFTALRRRVSMVSFLIRKGADLYAKESNGDTLLHVALNNIKEDDECLATTQILFNAGCRLPIPNKAGESPIDIAVSRGLVSTVEYLLSQGMSLPCRILFTALRRRVSMVPWLIRKGAALHAKEINGDTLVHVAIHTLDEAQCLTTTQVLVDAGCSSSTSNHTGQVPMEIAVSRGLECVVEYLLSKRTPLPREILFTALRYQGSMVHFLLHKGADVHVQKDNGDTPLHAAMRISKESLCHAAVRILVQAGCSTSTLNTAGILPIHIAVSQGFLSVVEYLLSLVPRYELPPDLLFSMSPLHSSSSMVRLLVDSGVNVGYTHSAGNGSLHHVMQFSDEGECLMATQSLIQAGCRHFTTNVYQKTPLHAAVEKQFPSVVEYLIANDAPLPPDILAFALKSWPVYERDPHKWKTMVSLLIRKGADVHTQDARGNTPMHYAVRLPSEIQCLEATKLLVEAGCSTSVPNSNDELPTQIAVARALFSVVEYLLSHGAPFPPNILLTVVQAQDSSSLAPRMVALLIRNGASASVCAVNGDSVLHVALARKDYWFTRGSLMEVVKALIREGCDPRARNSRGHTPLEVAVVMGYSEVEEYLRGIVPDPQPPFSSDRLSIPGDLMDLKPPLESPAPISPAPSPPLSPPSSLPPVPSTPSPPSQQVFLPLAGVQNTISNLWSRVIGTRETTRGSDP